MVIATLKEEQGVLGAYIRQGEEVSQFIPGGKYFGIGLNTELLVYAVHEIFPLALFVDNKTFDTWADVKGSCAVCGQDAYQQCPGCKGFFCPTCHHTHIHDNRYYLGEEQ